MKPPKVLYWCPIMQNAETKKCKMDKQVVFKCKTNTEEKLTCKVKGTQIVLGYFKTDKDAAIAYDISCRKYHGEYAKLNIEKVV